MLTKPAPVKGNQKKGRSADLMRKLKYELEFDAAEELVRLFRNRKVKVNDKIRIAQELMSYQYPKLKSMELKSNAGELIQFNIDLSGKKVNKESSNEAKNIKETA